MKTYKLSHPTEWQSIDAEFETQKRRLRPTTNEFVWIKMPFDFHNEVKQQTGKPIDEWCRLYSEAHAKKNDEKKSNAAAAAAASTSSAPIVATAAGTATVVAPAATGHDSMMNYLTQMFGSPHFGDKDSKEPPVPKVSGSPPVPPSTATVTALIAAVTAPLAATVTAPVASATPLAVATPAIVASATAIALATPMATPATAKPLPTVNTDVVLWGKGRLRFHTDLFKALFKPVLDPLVAFLGKPFAFPFALFIDLLANLISASYVRTFPILCFLGETLYVAKSLCFPFFSAAHMILWIGKTTTWIMLAWWAVSPSRKWSSTKLIPDLADLAASFLCAPSGETWEQIVVSLNMALHYHRQPFTQKELEESQVSSALELASPNKFVMDRANRYQSYIKSSVITLDGNTAITEKNWSDCDEDSDENDD